MITLRRAEQLCRGGAATPGPHNDNRPQATRPRFEVTWAADIEASAAKEFVVEGVFGRGEFSSVSGKPGTAKSAVITDAMCHVAAGMDWHGRPVKRGLAIYFAAERKKLTERRVLAFRERYDIHDRIPLAIVGGKLDLTRGTVDAVALVKFVGELEQACGFQCVWVNIDTLSRTFGGGDQNQSKDMARFIQSVDEMLRGTGAHISAIHHTPWNEDRGKGAIDLDGAVDASFLLKKSGKAFVFECDGANDAEEGHLLTFRLESVELGLAQDGKPITAPIVVPVKANLAGLYGDVRQPAAKLPAKEALALDLLKKVMAEDGVVPPGDALIPAGVRARPVEAWRTAFIEQHPSSKPDTARVAFRRASGALLEKGLVVTSGDWVWIAPDAT